MKQTIFILLVFHLSISAQKSDQLKWILGTWKLSMGNTSIIEKWDVKNDSTLVGRSYLIKGKDSIPQESMELVYKSDSWYLISTVLNQNNGQPITFKAIFSKAMEIICENPAHDFPQRISYRRVKDQLFASIEGKKNNRFGKQNFDYSKE